jgi:hypothetical protein
MGEEITRLSNIRMSLETLRLQVKLANNAPRNWSPRFLRVDGRSPLDASLAPADHCAIRVHIDVSEPTEILGQRHRLSNVDV